MYSSYFFLQDLVCAQFYYKDNFFLAGYENQIALYKYFIDDQKDDIKRYITGTRYKRVIALPLEGGVRRLTTMAAVNTYFSYLCLAAGSDHSLQVFDLNVGRMVRNMSDVDCHTLALTCQLDSSAQHPTHSFDLFFTSSFSGGITMWDLRTNR